MPHQLGGRARLIAIKYVGLTAALTCGLVVMSGPFVLFNAPFPANTINAIAITCFVGSFVGFFMYFKADQALTGAPSGPRNGILTETKLEPNPRKNRGRIPLDPTVSYLPKRNLTVWWEETRGRFFRG